MVFAAVLVACLVRCCFPGYTKAFQCPLAPTEASLARKLPLALHPNQGGLGNQLFALNSFRGISAFYGKATPNITTIIGRDLGASEITRDFVRDGINKRLNPSKMKDRLHRHDGLIKKEVAHFHPNSIYVSDRFEGAGAPRRFNHKIGQLELAPKPHDGGSEPFYFILHGYFESYKYFCHIAAEVKADMQAFLQRYQQPAKETAAKKESVVAVHLRVGDKTRESDECSYTAKYIKNAFDWFLAKHTLVDTSKQLVFEVFCGASPGAAPELAQCQQLVPSDTVYTDLIRWHKPMSAIEDLAAMAQCDHAIITLGTFGWWAGFLINGNVVAMRRQWLKAKKEGESEGNKDLYPPGWTVLQNECEGAEDQEASKESTSTDVDSITQSTPSKPSLPSGAGGSFRGAKLALKIDALTINAFTGAAAAAPAAPVAAAAAAAAAPAAAYTDCAGVEGEHADTPCPLPEGHALAYLCPSNPLPKNPSTRAEQEGAHVLKIVNRDAGAGFFASLTDVLNHLIFADEYHLTPLINFTNAHYERSRGSDFWRQFFIPVGVDRCFCDLSGPDDSEGMVSSCSIYRLYRRNGQ
jgi:hypothetical protein